MKIEITVAEETRLVERMKKEALRKCDPVIQGTIGRNDDDAEDEGRGEDDEALHAKREGDGMERGVRAQVQTRTWTWTWPLVWTLESLCRAGRSWTGSCGLERRPSVHRSSSNVRSIAHACPATALSCTPALTCPVRVGRVSRVACRVSRVARTQSMSRAPVGAS